MSLRSGELSHTAEPYDVPAAVPTALWSRLGRSTDDYRVFDDRLTDGVPEPVRRWLRHSIAPGTSLLTAAELTTVGSIRLGNGWTRYRARQRLSLDDGYVWAGSSRRFGLPVRGFDAFTGSAGEMQWRLAGCVRLMSQTGTEVTLSAAGRHAAEVLAALPAVALDPRVRWEEVDENRVDAELTVGDLGERLTLTIGSRGELRQLHMLRWGEPADEAYGLHRFGAVFDADRWFDGYRLPTLVTAGWHFGTARWTQGRFLAYRLQDARFR